MKVALVVLAGIACAMAQSMPSFMCSINCTGLADVLVSGAPYVQGATVQVYRVKDTARYDVSVQGFPFAAIYMRPDVNNSNGKSYLYSSALGGCDEREFLPMSKYQYNDTTKAYTYSVDTLSTQIFLGDDKPTKEIFVISGSMPLQVTVTYTECASFSHEIKDGLFSIDTCDDDAKTQASQAITSEQCGAPSPASSSSPSSAAAYVLPSALALLAAALLALF